jgi:hypothetical protein
MKDKVFYDEKMNMFFQTRGNNARDSLLCGGFCHYYNDSKTTTQTQVLSYSYVKKCLEVVALDKMEKYGIHNDGIGWRVHKNKVLNSAG